MNSRESRKRTLDLDIAGPTEVNANAPESEPTENAIYKISNPNNNKSRLFQLELPADIELKEADAIVREVFEKIISRCTLTKNLLQHILWCMANQFIAEAETYQNDSNEDDSNRFLIYGYFCHYMMRILELPETTVICFPEKYTKMKNRIERNVEACLELHNIDLENGLASNNLDSKSLGKLLKDIANQYIYEWIPTIYPEEKHKVAFFKILMQELSKTRKDLPTCDPLMQKIADVGAGLLGKILSDAKKQARPTKSL